MSYQEITILRLNKSILEEYVRKISNNPMWTIENAYYGDLKNNNVNFILKRVVGKEEIHINQLNSFKNN